MDRVPSTGLNNAARPRAAGRRVLLAWEMGEGFGHAARLLTLAERLRADGWSPVVAARDPTALGERYANAKIPVIAAPAHQSCFTGPGRFRATTYADLMGAGGYADRERLAALMTAWDQVLLQQAPDIVIADYSPLLSLAAFGRIPVIGVGDGFVTPPGLSDGNFPALRNSVPSVWNAATLLQTAREVQTARGRPLPASLPEIIEGSGQVVSVSRELDIYDATRPVPAAGPWAAPLPPLEPPASWPYVFSYLRMHHPLARRVLQVLADVRLPGECYLHDASPQIVAAVQQAGIKVHRQPPPLREALARASFLIHHGGIGSMETAALAGRPQLLLPRHLEQSLNTQRALAKLPGTFTVRESATVAQLRQRLPALLHDAQPLRAAQWMASRLAARQETAWIALQRLLAQLS